MTFVTFQLVAHIKRGTFVWGEDLTTWRVEWMSSGTEYGDTSETLNLLTRMLVSFADSCIIPCRIVCLQMVATIQNGIPPEPAKHAYSAVAIETPQRRGQSPLLLVHIKLFHSLSFAMPMWHGIDIHLCSMYYNVCLLQVQQCPAVMLIKLNIILQHHIHSIGGAVD